MIVGLFILLIVSAAYAPQGRDRHAVRSRMTMIAVTAAALLGCRMTNRWAGAFLVLFVVGALRTPNPSERLPLTIYPALVFAALYAVGTSAITRADAPILLLAIAGLGLIQALWLAVCLLVNHPRFMRTLAWNRRPLVTIYESHRDGWSLGQYNKNFAVSLAAVSFAAGLGLVVIGSSWGLLLSLLDGAVVLTLLYLDSFGWDAYRPVRTLGQGVLYLAAPAGVWLVLQGWAGWMVALALASVGGWTVWTRCPIAWSWRQELWIFAIDLWRSLSRHGRLVGAGPESWLHLARAHWGARHPGSAFPSHAHNEYLMVLVEQGALGLCLVLGYLVTTIWALLHADRIGTAVLMLGSVQVACAAVSFPWTFPHEIWLSQESTGRIPVHVHGSPAMNVLALVTAVLAEVVTT